VYEDEHLIAVLKPPNVHSAPTHRWRGGSMVNRLLARLGRAPYLMHRLDVDTSGLLLFGKTPGVVPSIMRQFRCVGARGAGGQGAYDCLFYDL
jgi:23S rRNA pseudouridine1911/1915/1917 synthase